jgi:hypothetical protein
MGLRKLGGFENLPILDLTRDGEGTKTAFKLISFKEDVGKFGSCVYTIEYEGEKMQFWGNTVLDSRLQEAELGSNLVVVYLGVSPSKDKGKSPFKNFDVFLDDPAYEGDDSKSEATAAKNGTKKTVPF